MGHEHTIKENTATPVAARQRKYASDSIEQDTTIIDIGDGVKIGGNQIVVMAGPCSVESEEQIISIAQELKSMGVHILRGGAYKPRTSPYECWPGPPRGS